MEPANPAFLDVPVLLERSQPRHHGGWFWYAVGVFLLIVLLSAYLTGESAAWGRAMEIISPLAMLGVVGVMMTLTSLTVHHRRTESRKLEAIEELLQLRRWPESALMLDGLLSQPTRRPQARAQALIYLASVLARYQRFSDAIAVQEYLLDHVHFDEETEFGLRLGRAMAMLREDHLFDADRAIADLRRVSQNRGDKSAGLALVEIYRDVKTGHPAEAIGRFEEMLQVMRAQLGHRLGDAYALLAKAYDLLGRETEAAVAYEKATLLTAEIELQRRYPEVAALGAKFVAARWLI